MSGKILIVDREPQTVRRAQAAAKAAGLGAVVASTTAYALELLGNERPDIALFDLTARDGSWTALVRQLRELDPEIAIIATGTRPSMELVMEAMRHRIADVLEKPISEEQLGATIQRILQTRGPVAPSAAIDIVLVDDDPMTLSFASRQLSARGVIARTVSTVKAARAEIAGRRPEVVVLDVVLAGETGLDLLPELAAASPPIPAILITASSDPGVAIRGLRGGAFAAFPKPLDWDAIYRSLVTARRWVALRSVGAGAVTAPYPAPAATPVREPVAAPEPAPAPAPAAPMPPIAEVPGCPLADHSHCHVHYLSAEPATSCEVSLEPPAPASIFHPEFHVQLLAAAPVAPPAPEPSPSPTFHPHLHVQTLACPPLPEPAPVAAPAPEPTVELEPVHEVEPMRDLEHEPELDTAETELPAGPPSPGFRVRTHCHLHFADSRSDAPLPASSPALPALDVAQSMATEGDLATQALARAALALANLPSGILVMDTRPAVVELNPAAEELLSLPRDRAVDGGRDELPHLLAFFDAARAVLETGSGRFHQEASLMLPRGPRTMGFGVVPLQRGQREGVLIYFQDITTRRAAAQQRRQVERLASLGLISAGLTTELADPIAMASTYADLIQKETSSIERCHQHAGRLRSALNRTSQLASYVTTLLNRPQTEPGPVEMHDVIRGVTASLQRKTLLGSHGSDLDLVANASVVMGEAIDFEHLMMTLLVSVNQTVPRGGTLHVSSRNHTGIFEMIVQSQDASIDVTDPGGRPPAEAADPGPALEICRSLVQRYGGAIRIDAGGSALRRFTVRMLPARAEQCTGWAVMGVAAPPLSTYHPPGESPVGLYIPDEATAEQCRTWLADAGLSVVAYHSTEEALGSLSTVPPSVMVLQGPPQEGRWLQFLKKASETHRAALISLLEQGVSPRLQADLDELSGHRSLRWPVERLELLQAVALAELEGLDLRARSQSS